MPDIRSVLYVDFDNIFGTLKALNRAAGLAFAREPAEWLERLRRHDIDGGSARRFLQCRLYLNPAGWVHDEELGDASGRLFFSKFRPRFTEAGFEVIDCPNLTRQKNAADIKMVVDVLDALRSGVPFDELVLASADADFTPLLQVLRGADRRLLVLSAGETVPAYRSIADSVVEPAALVELMGPVSTSPGPPPDPDQVEVARAEAERIVTELLSAAPRPLPLQGIRDEVRSQIGPVVEDTAWFGHRMVSAFVRQAAEGRFRAEGHKAWDPSRHEAPLSATTAQKAPTVVHEVTSITGLPPLPSKAWPRVLGALASFALTSDTFNMSTCTATVRDVLDSTDTPIGRNAVTAVVRQLKHAGVMLDATPPPDTSALLTAYVDHIVRQCHESGRSLTPDELGTLGSWLQGAWTAEEEYAEDGEEEPFATGEPGPANLASS